MAKAIPKITVTRRRIYGPKNKRTKKKPYLGFVHLSVETYPRKTVRSGIGRIRIRGEWWTLVIVAEEFRGKYGYFDHALNMIVVDGTLKNNEFLDTLLHEASHGLDVTRKEKVIREQGQVLSSLMLACGYKN